MAIYFTISMNISFCVNDYDIIFLDLKRDRYFALSRDRSLRLASQLSGARPGTSIVLSNTIPTAFCPAGACTVMPHEVDSVMSDSSSMPEIALSRWELWSMQPARLSTLTRMRFTPIRQLLRPSRKVSSHPDAFDRKEVERICAAWRVSRTSFPARLSCLPDSLALRSQLRRHGQQSRLVIGVKSNPFAAHCWVQIDGQVLNDELETVTQFSPIFVV